MKYGKRELKDIELNLISELMKNSRRSDIALAQALGVTQPTVSMTRRRLEKIGLIKEYTMILDWRQLGYQLMAFTLVSMKDCAPFDGNTDLPMKEMHEKAPSDIVFFQRGIGDNYSGIVVSFHREYADYLKLRDFLATHQFVTVSGVSSFIVDLNDEVHYRDLTFSTIAKHLLTLNKKAEDQQPQLKQVVK